MADVRYKDREISLTQLVSLAAIKMQVSAIIEIIPINSGADSRVYYSGRGPETFYFEVDETAAVITANAGCIISVTDYATSTVRYINIGRIGIIATSHTTGSTFQYDFSGGTPKTLTVTDSAGTLKAEINGLIGSGGDIITTGITAFATGGQTNATQLVYGYSEITVCAADYDSVKLPIGVAGGKVTIFNDTSHIANVYPFTSGTIDDGSANAPVSLMPGVTLIFTAITSVNWEMNEQGIEFTSDIIGTKQVNHTITVETTTTAATAGGNLTVKAGQGATSGAGGITAVAGGIGGLTGTGGAVTITSGAGGATSGNSGPLTAITGNETGADSSGIATFGSGTTASAVSGNVSITSGAVSVTSDSGAVSIGSGNTVAGTSGSLTATTGSGTTAAGALIIGTGSATSAGGNITISTGTITAGTSGNIAKATGTGTTGSGLITCATGAASAGASGSNSMTTGAGTTATGLINIATGAASGGTSGVLTVVTGTGTTASGAITFGTGAGTAGTSGGNSGTVSISTGAAGTATTGTAGTGGAISIAASAGGAASGAAGIGSAGGSLTLTTGAGGASSSATGGVAGIGGGLTITAGNGGAAAGTGIAGGAATACTITTGTGGASTHASGGAGGAGAALTITTGNGGAVTNAAVLSGVGGAINITAGNAGAGSTVGATGGAITITGGTGVGTSGFGGNVNLIPGVSTSASQASFVKIGSNTFLAPAAGSAPFVTITGGVTVSAADAKAMVQGYLELRGTTANYTMPALSVFVTAIGFTPTAGSSFEFRLNANGSTPMTAGNTCTVLGSASVVFDTSVGATLATVTATAGVNIGIFRITFSDGSGTAAVLSRING